MRFNRGRIVVASSTLRARRRRRARVLLVSIAALLVVVGSSVFFGLHSPHTRLQTIQVTGTDPSTNKSISLFIQKELAGNYFFVVPRDSILFYFGNHLAIDILKKYPRLETASVALTSLSSISVTVSERLPQALWCGPDPADTAPCLVLDAKGIAYGAAEASSSSTPYVVYYGALDSSSTPPQFLTTAQFRALSLFVDLLAQKIDAGPAVSAAVNNEDDVTVTFQDGFRTLFILDDASTHSGDLLQRVSLVLQSQPFSANKIADFEYLDLRFGDKLYYKLKGSAAAESASTTHH
jgi:hypothetical protein